LFQGATFFNRRPLHFSTGVHRKVLSEARPAPVVQERSDSLQQLEAELGAAGFRLEKAWSSSSVGDRDYVHNTHRILRGEVEVACAAIVPWEQRADLKKIKPEMESALVTLFDAYKQRAFGITPPTKSTPHPSKSFLTSIDYRFTKLVASGRIDSAQSAISRGDPNGSYAELSQAYGSLQQIICLSGPHQAKCILVFEDGTGLLGGADSYIPILTFGYSGQGPRTFSAFLSAAGFSLIDASQFQPPLLVRRDGSTMKGRAEGSEICWEDGTTLLIPKFPAGL
jgi:hypothetical protein